MKEGSSLGLTIDFMKHACSLILLTLIILDWWWWRDIRFIDKTIGRHTATRLQWML